MKTTFKNTERKSVSTIGEFPDKGMLQKDVPKGLRKSVRNAKTFSLNKSMCL